MTYPGNFPPKFELSNSSHARKAEESFVMHTIVQSEWSGGTARVQSECAHALRPKFELSNSSHARKAEESFAMHTIVQSEWSSGTARKVSLHISKILAYRQNIYPRPLLSQTTSHISPVSSFLPNFIAASSLSPSRILPPGSPWSSSKTSPAVPPPATTTSPPGYASLLSLRL